MHGVHYIDAGHLYMYMPLTPRLSKALGSLHNGARCLDECTTNIPWPMHGRRSCAYSCWTLPGCSTVPPPPMQPLWYYTLVDKWTT